MLEIGSVDVLLFAVVGIFAGALGSLVGIGGGLIVVPALVLIFDIDIRYAVSTSLVAVVATSSAAGSVYVGSGLANMRLGMTLEIATTVGGISGGLLATTISPSVLAGIFAGLMVLTAALQARGMWTSRGAAAVAGKTAAGGSEKSAAGGYEERGKLAGGYFDQAQGGFVHYEATHLPAGAGISYGAGVASGLLGIGGGFLKVPAMNLAMGVPIKVAAATGNFMVGVTAVSSLFVYIASGLVHPFLAASVTLGIVVGALAGTVAAARAPTNIVKLVLVVIILLAGAQMLLKAIGIDVG